MGNAAYTILKYKPRSEIKFVRFDVLTAVTIKNVVFWDIKTQFVLYRRHITSLLESPAS
jgi:hypothetical protein